PAAPDLAETLTRLSPAGARQASARAEQAAAGARDVRDVLGMAGERVLPPRVWGTVSAQDLAILRMSPSRFYGEKLLYAFIGLVIGPLLSVMPLIFWGLPLYLPVAASLGMAVVLWFIPAHNVADDARKA